jgi:hypothetical protein
VQIYVAPLSLQLNVCHSLELYDANDVTTEGGINASLSVQLYVASLSLQLRALELDDAKESGTSASHSLQIQLKYRRKASFR